MCVVCRVSCVVCRVSCVVCRVSCVVCRVSCVVCHLPCAPCGQFLAFLKEHSFGSIISKLDKICPPTAAEQAAEAALRTSSTRGRPRLDNPTQEAVQAPPAVSNHTHIHTQQMVDTKEALPMSHSLCRWRWR